MKSDTRSSLIEIMRGLDIRLDRDVLADGKLLEFRRKKQEIVLRKDNNTTIINLVNRRQPVRNTIALIVLAAIRM